MADQRARSFGSAVGDYEAGRPVYPAAAVAWMLEPVQRRGTTVRVADVGAGTGKLTAVIRATGAEVVAVEPDARMRERLRAAVPGVPAVEGTAEAMPLHDASRDAVLLGQAWHWVEPAAGSAEVARVLRPGGVLGLVWNIRDEQVDWVRRMSAVMHGSNAERMMAGGGPTLASPFGEAAHRTWDWEMPMTRAALLAMAHSRSYVITADTAERARIDRELSALFDEIGAVGEATVFLPYRTHAYRAVRP